MPRVCGKFLYRIVSSGLSVNILRLPNGRDPTRRKEHSNQEISNQEIS
jgi:hypothetical protein